MRAPFFLGVAVSMALAPSGSAAADKATMACIQSSDTGQSARDSGDLLRARESFALCSDPKCPAPIRRDCSSWGEQVQKELPSIVVGARDDQHRDVLDSTVTIDDRPTEADRRSPIELNPGPHVIRWARSGREPVEMRVVLRPEEKNRALVATLISSSGGAPTATGGAAASGSPEPSTRASLPTATYVLGGIGIAAIGTFAFLGLRAKADSNSMHDTCAPACDHADVQALKTKMVVADIALGVGVASLVGAAWFALARKSPPANQAWDVRVATGPAGMHAEAAIDF